jgi:hypothetical protein
MNASVHQHIDINEGLDFERALGRLRDQTGAAFRAYRELKNNPNHTALDLAGAKELTIQAMVREKQLRPDRVAEIRSILSGDV